MGTHCHKETDFVLSNGWVLIAPCNKYRYGVLFTCGHNSCLPRQAEDPFGLTKTKTNTPIFFFQFLPFVAPPHRLIGLRNLFILNSPPQKGGGASTLPKSAPGSGGGGRIGKSPYICMCVCVCVSVCSECLFFSDRKTSRTALLSLRGFLFTAFLALFLSRGSQRVCMCVCVCVCVCVCIPLFWVRRTQKSRSCGPMKWWQCCAKWVSWLVCSKNAGCPQWQATTNNRLGLYLQHVVLRTKKRGIYIYAF